LGFIEVFLGQSPVLVGQSKVAAKVPGPAGEVRPRRRAMRLPLAAASPICAATP